MGNPRRYVMWLVLAAVVGLLAALIVAIALEVQVSTQTSVVILVICGLFSLMLILTSSRLVVDRGRVRAQPDEFAGVAPSAGNVSNWVFLADSYAQRQEFVPAEKLYRRAADAGHRGAAASLSEVLYELGRDEEAEHYNRMANEAGQ